MPVLEKRIILENTDLLQLLGYNDVNLHLIENRFKSAISVRGNNILIRGDEAEIDKIDKIFKEMAYVLNRTGSLNEHDVKTVVDLIDVQNLNQNAKLSSQKTKINNIIYHGSKDVIKARTPKQIEYFEKVVKNDLVFSIGPAGTGKTFLAVAMALAALRLNQVGKIIITRPAVEAGESLGFLPGDLQEKIDPYLRPITDALNFMMSFDKVSSLKEKQIIEITPLAYMRGRTLSNSFIILDEAQNATSSQMKMFLTRLGERSKAIITGDITQIDLADKGDSGLLHAQRILKEINGIEFVYFNNKDVVRHKLVAEIIKAYEIDTESKKKK